MVPALPPARSALTDAALRPLGAPVVQRSTNTVVTGMTAPASCPPSALPANEPPPSSCAKLVEPLSSSPPPPLDEVTPSSPSPGRPFERFDPHATDAAMAAQGTIQEYRPMRILYLS